MACEGLGFRDLSKTAADNPGQCSSTSEHNDSLVVEHEDNNSSCVSQYPGALTVCDRAPYFVILGAQKAGSTALYSYITQHPSVAPALRKETHFLDWKWGIYSKCKVPNTLETDTYDALTHSSWNSQATPSVFPCLTRCDFEDDGIGCCCVIKTEKTQRSNNNYKKSAKIFAAENSQPNVSRMKKQKKIGPVSCNKMRQKYLLMFPFKKLLKNPALITGEASPSYALYGQVPARLKRLQPKAKMILLVRNPVARAYSHYQMTVDPVGSDFVKKIRGTYIFGNKTFEEAVKHDMCRLRKFGLSHISSTSLKSADKGVSADENDNHEQVQPVVVGHSVNEAVSIIGSCKSAISLPQFAKTFNFEYFQNLPNGHGAHCFLGRGLYMLQICQWLRQGFSRKQILVVCTERLQTNPQQQLSRIFRFLNISPCTDIDTTPINTAKQRGRTFNPMAEDTRHQLRKFFEPHNQALYRFTGENFGW